jgi:hypothetical protein
MKGKPFVIVGVNTDGREAYAKGRAELPVPWRSFDDGATNGPISRRWCVSGFPTLFLIDHEGVIRKCRVSEEELAAAVRELVAAAK